MNLTSPTQPLESPRRLLALCFAAAAAWYLAWRWAVVNPAAPGLSYALLALETLAIGGVLAQAVVVWRSSRRQPQALVQPLPATDVLVWAGSHEPGLLRKALRSALALHGRNHVYLLAQKPPTEQAHNDLQQLATDMGCTLVCGEGAAGAPAALANQVLAISQAPFLAWLDGSHASRADFLQQVLGHFEDPQLAFVQTASGVPGEGAEPSQAAASGRWRRWDALFAPALAHRHLHQGWDRWNAALWAGSGAVLRRSALAAAGGFAGPEASMTARTTVRLQAQGLHGAWHPERLVFSLAPDQEAARQQPGAAGAAWSVLLGEGVLHRAGLTAAQRLRHLAHALAGGLNGATALALALPAAVLASGALPFNTGTTGTTGFAQNLALHLLPVLLLGALLQTELTAGAHSAAAQLGHRLARLGLPAQLGLLSLNVGAVLAAVALALASPAAAPTAAVGAAPLSATALAALSTWALLNALALGAAIKSANRAAGHTRSSQRFTVTLAAELVGATGERVQGTVDDLSDGGLRFYGSLLPSMAQQQMVNGTLHLPDGPLDFTGEVRHLGASSNGSMHQPRSVGLKLQLDATSQARIETFILSSDLQWRLQGHIETPATPLGRLFPGLLPPPRPALARRFWNGAQLRLHTRADATPVLCSAPAGGAGSGPHEEDDLVVSHAALPEHVPLILDVYRRTPIPSRGVTLQRIEDPASVGAAATAMFTYRALPSAMPVVPMEYEVAVSPFMVVNDPPLLLPTGDGMPTGTRAGRSLDAAALAPA